MYTPDQKLIQQIDSWIQKEKTSFIKDLDRLVAIPSISEKGDEAYPFGKSCGDVLDEITRISAGYGLTVENHEYYCGSCLVKGTSDKARRIGLFAHLDVVPLGEGWENPPLSCTLKDGHLIGRGVGDNKGPGICALYAVRFLKEHGIRLKNDVLLYFGLAEETGMEDIEYFCKTQRVPELSLVTDTNFPVCYGEKGLLRAELSWKGGLDRDRDGLLSFEGGSVVNVIPAKAEAVLTGLPMEMVQACLKGKPGLCAEMTPEGVKVTAEGISKHAAFPEGAVNAIHVLAAALTGCGLIRGESEKAVQAAAEITADFYGASAGIPFKDKESGPLTCVGSVAGMKDGRFTLAFDVRYPVTVKGEDVIRAFKARAEGKGFTFLVKECSAPAFMPLDQPYIPLLCGICDYVQGKHYEPYTMGGGTYSRKLPAAVGFGPGVPDAENPFPAGHGQGHQPDECVPFEMLLKGLKTYIIALIELDKIL